MDDKKTPTRAALARLKRNVQFRVTAMTNHFRHPLSGYHEKRLVVLDNLRLENVVLRNCTLVYGGGSVHINDCALFGCNFVFTGTAGQTLAFMKGMDQFAPDVVASTFPIALGLKTRDCSEAIQ